MYTTIRQYTGVTPATFDTLMSRKADVEKLIRQVPGLVQYDLVRTADGVTSVTICKDKVGTDESTKQVANWIDKNLPALKASAPVITSGEDVFHFSV